MDWIFEMLPLMLALLGVLVGAGLVFGTGCSIGRAYAHRELAQERHDNDLLRVRCERFENDKADLIRRLKASRLENVELSLRLIPSEEPCSTPLPFAQRGTIVLVPPETAA